MSADESMPPPPGKASLEKLRTPSVPEEATQAYGDAEEFSDEEEENDAGTPAVEVWGRLVNHGDLPNIELRVKTEFAGSSDLNSHVIGRSKKADMEVDAVVDFDQVKKWHLNKRAVS